MRQEILQNAAIFSLQNVTRVTLFITNYNDQALSLKKIKIIEVLRIYLKKFKKSKKLYYQKIPPKCKNNIKTASKMIKEVTRKSSIYHESFPESLLINKKSIIDKNIITVKFNNFLLI